MDDTGACSLATAEQIHAEQMKLVVAAAKRSIKSGQKALHVAESTKVEAPFILGSLGFDDAMPYQEGAPSPLGGGRTALLSNFDIGRSPVPSSSADDGNLGDGRPAESQADDLDEAEDRDEEEEFREQMRDDRLFQQRYDRVRKQMAERRRSDRQEDNERRAMELEELHDVRYAKTVRDVAAAEDKVGEMNEELVEAQKRKSVGEGQLREEVAEAREDVKKAEAQAKHRARVLRSASDRSEKAISEFRAEAQAVTQAREEVARRNKKAASEMRQAITDLEKAHAVSLRRSDEIATRWIEAESSSALVESRLEVEVQKVLELQSTARLLQLRSVQSSGPDDDVDTSAVDTRFIDNEGDRIHAQVAEQSAEALATCEEAALSTELSNTEVRCLSLEMEERRLARCLGQVEGETSRMQERLRTSPRTAAGMDGDAAWAMTKERDDLRIRVRELHTEIESEAASSAKRIADNEASSTAEYRETLACEELSFVYEQLRGVCVDGHRDLEELAAVVQDRQASFALSRDLESTLQTEEWKVVSALPEGAAMEAHDEAMQRLRSEHLQFVRDTELSLCSMEITQVELGEAERAERTQTAKLLDEVRRTASSPEAIPALASPGRLDTELNRPDVAAARIYRETLTAYANSLQSQSGLELASYLPELQSQECLLQMEMARATSKHQELQARIQSTEAEAIATGDEALAVVALPVDTQGLTDVASALEDMRLEYHMEIARLSGRYADTRSAAELCRATHEQEQEERMRACRAAADGLREELASKQREGASTDAKVNDFLAAVQALQARVARTEQEQAAAESVAKTEAGMTQRMQSQLEALGMADEELQARYTMLGVRAEHAARASECEEEALQAVSAELARVRSNQIITDGALCSEAASLEAAVTELAVTMKACEARRATLASEAEQLTEVTARSYRLANETKEELTMTHSLEGNMKEEMEEVRIASENLASAKSEALWLSRARTREAEAVAELRGELAKALPAPNQPLGPPVAAVSTHDLDAMRSQIETLQRDQGQLVSRGQNVFAELSAAQERRAALQRAVKAQEESYAAQQQSQLQAISQGTSDSKHKIAELNAAVAADRARLAQDNRTLDIKLQSIGSLQGEVLCAEAAAKTEAEALVAIERDREAENAACAALRQRLIVARSELGALRSQAKTGSASGAVDDREARSEQVEADVLDAMARAARTSPGEVPGEALAVLGTPQFARQLLIAQALLEEWHNREILKIKERGLSWRRSLEEQAARERASKAMFEEARQSKLKSSSQELGEQSKLEHVSGLEDGGGSSSSASGSAGPAEAASPPRADGATLARMNASLRETQVTLCQNQTQLEDIARERDRLQAHLMMALERASGQEGGPRPAPSLMSSLPKALPGLPALEQIASVT